MSNDLPPAGDEMAPLPEPVKHHVNVFFRLATGMVVVFVVTIFALIAIMFGDPKAPIAILLDRIGMQLIVGEMCAILVVGALAMTVDRRAVKQSTPSEDSGDVR